VQFCQGAPGTGWRGRVAAVAPKYDARGSSRSRVFTHTCPIAGSGPGREQADAVAPCKDRIEVGGGRRPRQLLEDVLAKLERGNHVQRDLP
jgi:hypothetical protein